MELFNLVVFYFSLMVIVIFNVFAIKYGIEKKYCRLLTNIPDHYKEKLQWLGYELVRVSGNNGIYARWAVVAMKDPRVKNPAYHARNTMKSYTMYYKLLSCFKYKTTYIEVDMVKVEELANLCMKEILEPM